MMSISPKKIKKIKNSVTYYKLYPNAFVIKNKSSLIFIF